MKKILIIDHESSIAELERDYLQVNGFHVEIEINGDTGLKKALNQPFDLIILDLMLPTIDGFEICKQIRIEKDIPILIVSAKKDDIDKVRGFGLGADDYITKPFSPNELVARVKAHLSRYERLISNCENKTDEIKTGGLRIYRTARRVYVNEKEVPFTTKEFDLLTFLAMNPNHVFSKDELFDKLWGTETFGDIATVTVHVRKVREKIETPSSNHKYIETILGAGYRFNG